ncbi:hypothetical protein [Marinobacter sp. AN1]|uniref:hypothetical protein n=1 Tax=Marinobacter sp. AN1 TaxID=2886046 RepID=UPI002232A350|nr:hypothetical protein [Marinobacter sp. AN1]UZD64059.1 hypothetical protein LJ360_10305 [Marinobacter sp. AN1]
MTMLHAYAQQVVRDHGFIQLPNFHTTVSPQNAKSANESLPVQRPGYLAALKDTSLERGYPTRPRLIADVHGIEPGVGSLYVEIRVHHEVDDSKIAALKNAGLDVIEVDLRSLVDQPGLTKEQIVEAVVSSAGREWISQQRFERDIRAAREKMQRLEEADAQERRLARAAQEACGATKKQWRAEHQHELGLISAYAELENRKRALDKLWDWCHHPRRTENRVFTRLIDQFGEVPQAVNLPVRGELAFKVHRLYWQTLIFEGVILRIFDNQVKRIAQYKRKNRRFFYGEEIAWLSDTPQISPVGVYEFLKQQEVRLTDVANTFEQLAGGEPLAENHSTRPASIRHVTVKEYAILPKPVPTIRRYLKALAGAGILSVSNDTFFIPYQRRPSVDTPITDFEKLAQAGLMQYQE